jgi:hypothetical protein
VSPVLGVVLRILGIGALVAGGLAVALAALIGMILLGPVIAAIVFLVDPSWFHGAAEVRWPEPTFRNFVAVALLALLASRPHAHAHGRTRRHKR